MHCLNCIRCMQNSTFETGLSLVLTSDISISKITNFKDKFSSEVYKNKAEKIFFWICFCFAIAYARSLMFVLMLMSMLMSHASVDIFVLFYLVLIVMSINLNLKGLMFLRTLFSTWFEYITLITWRKFIISRVDQYASEFIRVQLMRVFVRFR